MKKSNTVDKIKKAAYKATGVIFYLAIAPIAVTATVARDVGDGLTNTVEGIIDIVRS